MSGTKDLSPHGHPKGSMVDGTWTRNSDLTIGTPVATKAALKAVAAANRADGDVRIVDADKSMWIFDADSTAADTTDNMVLTPDAGDGRWLRHDKLVDLKLAIGHATADGAELFEVPAGMRLLVDRAFWEMTADWTGGSSSAIGLSSDVAPHDTAGDLLGGAAGDVAANLEAADGVTQGTIGVSYSAAPKMVVLEAGSKVLFNRITSAFTAGAGFAHLIVMPIS